MLCIATLWDIRGGWVMWSVRSTEDGLNWEEYKEPKRFGDGGTEADAEVLSTEGDCVVSSN